MGDQPRQNDARGQQPAGRENERNRDRPRDGDRGSGRENERNARAEGEGTEPRPAAARQGGRKPVNKLSLYMRGVAVLALLVIGGVGVYKGRAMLNAKETGFKVAEGKDGEKAEGKPGEKPTETKPAPTKGLSSGFTPNTGAVNPTTNPLADKSPVPKKPGPALSSSLLNKGPKAESASSTKPSTTDKKPKLGSLNLGKKDDKAKPAGAAGYSVSDANPTNSDAGYSGAGDYGSIPEGPAHDGGSYAAAAPPKKPTGTSLSDLPAESGYSSNPGDYGSSEPAPPASYGSLNDDGLVAGAGQPVGDEEPIAPPPKFAGLGAPPKNVIPKTTDKPGTPSTLSGTTPKPDLKIKPKPNLTTNPKPAITPPPNTLTTGGPLDRPIPSRPAAAADRYSSDLEGSPSASPPSTPVEPGMIGMQQPSIAVEKFAPEEVQVGKPAKFEIVVKNVGKVPAYDVTVTDEIPQGTRFRSANPQPSSDSKQRLVWKLGTLPAGKEQVIELQLVPEMEGEIGSVAQVTFQAQAASKSIVTQPKLQIRHDAPPQVHAGDVATVRLTITNSGTGAASNLVLASDVPAGFVHDAGNSLETKVNALRPGESTQISLQMKAVKAGQYQQAFVVEEEDGKVVAEDAAEIEIVAPGLDVGIAGPRKRYVERQATHSITIVNPGTASAKDVDLVAYLPRGFKFVSAAPSEAGGQYNATQHAVVWGIEELVAGASATVQLTTLPIEAGDQKVRVEARSANGLTADFEQLVAVDAVSELPFTIHDLADPIEIGSETTYEIRIANRGAKEATNVTISVDFPADLKPLDGGGAAQATVSGQHVEFAPIGRVAQGAELIVKVRAEGLRAGDHRIAVSLTSDEQQQPITREESTRVYADQ